MKKIVIFGAGKIGQAVTSYIERWNLFEIAGFATDRAYIQADEFEGRPWIASEEMADRFPPAEYAAFVAVGYQDLNRLRADKVAEVTAMGYELVSIVSPDVPADFKCGRNCMVAEGGQIQPHVTAADNVFIWSGAMVGHHTVIESDCWITGGAQIGGVTTLGQGTFAAVGAVVGNEVVIGSRCMLGAGTLVTKDLPDGTVLATADTEPHRLNSDQFIRFSSCFASR